MTTKKRTTFHCEYCGIICSQRADTYQERSHHFCNNGCGYRWRDTPIRRLHRYTSPPDSRGCTLWLGQKTDYGYGTIIINGKLQRAHRVAWELANGPIPKGFFVCHTCDVPACVNPEHLFLGTPQDNVNDMIAKGRQSRPMLKVTEAQAEEICSRYAEGSTTQILLAREYGISQQHVSHILGRKRRS